MRFIHTADIHWGMIPDSDMPWGKDRANDIRETFKAVIEKTRELHADCLFIAGDLFHRTPLTRDLRELNYLFSSIPATHVVIIAGNRDCIEASSALYSFEWSANVTYFLQDTPERVYFDDINTEVWGFSYHQPECRDSVIQEIPGENGGPIRILLAHGGDPEHMPVDADTLARLPFDYIALGHFHRPSEVVERKAVYAGSPEPLSPNETGEHGIYFGDINPITHRMQRLQFIPMSTVGYIPLQIGITPKTTGSELLALVQREIEKRGEDNIYRLRITGKHAPGETLNISSLQERYRIVEISDESEPDYNFHLLYKEHPTDMIGYYIRTLQKEDPAEMSHVEKQALYYGIDALLRTSKDPALGEAAYPAVQEGAGRPAALSEASRLAAQEDTGRPAALSDAGRPAVQEGTGRPAAQEDTEGGEA